MPLENVNNTLVKDGAQIQPPQAFVDSFQQQIDGGAISSLLHFDAVGMTEFYAVDYLAALLDCVFAATAGLTVTFANNHLAQHGVNLVISTVYTWANSHQSYSGGSLSVQGGTNAVPDGDVTDLITALVGWGWTVTHN